MATRQTANITVPAGLPGGRITVGLRHRWKDPDDARNHAPDEGSQGFYAVTLDLARQVGTPTVGDVFPADSSLVLADLATSLRLDKPYAVAEFGEGPERVRLEAYVNPLGRLAKLVAHALEAQTFADAERKASAAAQRLLSQISVLLNTPLHLANIEIVEISTGNIRKSLVMAYDNVRLPKGLHGQTSQDFSFYASLYREALTSNSHPYQFLCFYKIIEGLQARRSRIKKELVARGKKPVTQSERVPSSPDECKTWLNELFSMNSDWGDDNLNATIPHEIRSYKFTRVIDDYLRPIRVRIAHAVLEKGEATLMLDEGTHSTHLERWLPTVQCLARRMLLNDFTADFGQAGKP